MTRYRTLITCTYRDGSTVVVDRFQPTAAMVREVWAAMPLHGRRR